MTFIPPTRRGNPWAIASIILGIFACIPYITSALAVIFGFIGLARSKNDGLRPVAITGIVLGIIGIIIWGMVTGAFISFVRTGAPLRENVGAFVDNLQQGNLKAARTYASVAISDEQLQAWSLELRANGKLQSVSVSNTNIRWINGVGTATLSGTLNFQNSKVPFSANFQRIGGQFLISSFQIRAASTTLPANVTWSDIMGSRFAGAA